MAYIELHDVTFTYALCERPAINGLSLCLERGGLYALVGANGSGKTTLCNIVRGFVPRFFAGTLEGEVLFDGRPLEHWSMGELALKMGYVFQNPFNQITGACATVFEEVAFGLENFGVPVVRIRERVCRALEQTNTAELADKNPLDLSGGQQQRVALASVLVMGPDVLVIDEPTSQLDPQETERVFNVIARLREDGKTILLAEHKMELVAEHADRVIALDEGCLAAFGEKHDVLGDASLEARGVTLPPASALAWELRRRGMDVSGRPVMRRELAKALRSACPALARRPQWES